MKVRLARVCFLYGSFLVLYQVHDMYVILNKSYISLVQTKGSLLISGYQLLKLSAMIAYHLGGLGFVNFVSFIFTKYQSFILTLKKWKLFIYLFLCLINFSPVFHLMFFSVLVFVSVVHGVPNGKGFLFQFSFISAI